MEGRKNNQASQSKKKPRLRWTKQLHDCFLKAVYQLGGAYKATPKDIVEVMGIKEINTTHIKSHLQQYRLNQDIYEMVKRNAARNGKVMIFEANQEDDRQRRIHEFQTNQIVPEEQEGDGSCESRKARPKKYQICKPVADDHHRSIINPLNSCFTLSKASQEGHMENKGANLQRCEDPTLRAGRECEKGSNSINIRGNESKLARNWLPFDLNVSSEGI